MKARDNDDMDQKPAKRLERSMKGIRSLGGVVGRLMRVRNERGVSVDALDTIIRTLAMAVVVALSVTRALWPDAESNEVRESANHLVVAALVVLYNMAVVTILGVPWRAKPNAWLFIIDGVVALLAIAITGGIFSPFIVLTYALVIGATLRLTASRPLYALAGSVAILLTCALFITATPGMPTAAVLVVEMTSLVMVAITALSLKRIIEIEGERSRLEEQQARRLNLLHKLTGSILEGDMDTGTVLKTVAQAASGIAHADRVMAVLLATQSDEEVVRSNGSYDPVLLSADERLLAESALIAGRYTTSSSPLGGNAGYYLTCPVWVDERWNGALLVWRSGDARFDASEISLLSSFSQQMAMGVRLTHLYEIERERAEQSQERERLERDLLSLVSHDLRTPLTAIRTCVGALASLEGSELATDAATYDKLIQNVDRNAERLSRMVDDLLDMARLRHGRVALALSPTNLGVLIRELSGTVLHTLSQKHQKLEFDLPREDNARWERLHCMVDKHRIEQVLLNLFTNAQRHAPPGSTITIGATERRGEIRCFVQDEGPGITDSEQELIFDRFYSGRSALDKQSAESSLGLGLAIARAIVEMHGGRIWVQSRPGAGSTFCFTLARCDRDDTTAGHIVMQKGHES